MTYKVSAEDVKGFSFVEDDMVRRVLSNVATILATPKGSVPLYREFGLDMSFLDKPEPVARSRMVAPVREAVQRWEPRARVGDVDAVSDPAQPGRLVPVVTIEIEGESL